MCVCSAAMLYRSSSEFKLSLADWVGLLPSFRFSEKESLGTRDGPSLAARDGGLLCAGFVHLSLSPCPFLLAARSTVPGAKGWRQPAQGSFAVPEPCWWLRDSPGQHLLLQNESGPRHYLPGLIQTTGRFMVILSSTWSPVLDRKCKREIKMHKCLHLPLWIFPPCFISVHFYLCEVKVSPIWKSTCLRSSPQILLASCSISIHFC